MIFGWIFDAASQHRCKMLENVNMLKHCACAVISMISMFAALTIFYFFLRFSMQNGSKKSQGFGDRFWFHFGPLLAPFWLPGLIDVQCVCRHRFFKEF